MDADVSATFSSALSPSFVTEEEAWSSSPSSTTTISDVSSEDYFSSSTAMPPPLDIKSFGVLDYAVFVGLLAMSALIGVYFAFFAKQKQNTTQEYLMGGKTMGVFPISMSLIASYISGVSSLGVPAEVYTYGTQYGLVLAAEVCVCISVAYVFMPVFYNLQLTSAYKYLELRYDQKVRLLLSGISIISMVLYIPLMIYVPALAFSHVSGINIYVTSPVICAVCIFYTSLGGLKAVVWADTVQSFSMLAGVVVVCIMGTIGAGSMANVFEKNYKSGRLEFFNMDLNPLVRHTFWTVFIGNFFMWLSHCAASQAILQRCLALPTLKKARRAVLSLAFGISCFVVLFIYTGMVIYANHYDCDPVKSKKIRKSDQILPYLVMQFGDKIPGLPGLFIAGIFSASLSSMSTLLNAATAMILEDFIKPWSGIKMSEKQASTILKFIVLILGIISTALVLVVDRLGAIIQVSRSLSGISAGPSLGIFILGLLTPWMNAKGALVGGIVGFIVSAWVSVGAQMAIAKKWLRFPIKPVTLEGCSHLTGINYTSLTFGTAINTHIPEHDDVFWLYRVSYLYYTLIGFITMGIVGMIVSYFTGFENVETLDRNLLCKISHRLLPKKISTDHPEPTEIKLLEQEKEEEKTDNLS
ncbi:sodium-coupled monocarboxylate transporter 1-like [Ischnura elegans]|uniref:sodium-coupled monocarboxylate transporter 1-like n=1 Tax=Ischnura elegans TaxID=197161 RepID=UPI001ED8B967|nr:sodium-coupled monocarboxylate transporter 1-like [Ischnura elegans]XP_046396027.1 sodium-coupled monocarboxylate transporter 1-like [Ischnura elegans]